MIDIDGRIDHENDITFNAMQGNSQRTWQISVTFPVNQKHRVAKCQLGHSLKLVGFTPGVGKRDRGIETRLEKSDLTVTVARGRDFTLILALIRPWIFGVIVKKKEQTNQSHFSLVSTLKYQTTKFWTSYDVIFLVYKGVTKVS